VLSYVRRYGQQAVLCMTNTADHALGSITLTGSAASLEPGEHTLVNLLVPGDTLEIVVDPTYEISGITLSAYETAVYGFDTLTDAGGGPAPGARIRLGQNYPNPFNPSTTIPFVLPRESRVNLSIYDVQGRQVRTVGDGVFPEGSQEIIWDGTDESGNSVDSGVYFCRLTACDLTLTKKMVLLR
jgi:hypothetical protein